MSADRGTTSGVRLLAGLFAIYILSYASIFRLDDEHILAARAESLALWGQPGESQVYGNDRVRALMAMGEPATAIEPLQTVVGSVLLRITSFTAAGSTQTLFLLNLFFTVGTAGLIGWNVLALGFGRPVALWCTALFGLATMAFPYSTTFFRDPLAMFFTTLAFLGWTWMTGGQPGRFRTGAITWIVGIGAGVLSKNTVLVLLPAFAISAVGLAIWRQGGARGVRRQVLWVSAGVLAGAIALLVVPKPEFLARYRWEYYVSLGRFFLESVQSDLIPAFLGPFLSPAKSIFLFSPALLLLPLAVRDWPKHLRFALPGVLAVLGLAAVQALFYRERWAEASGWGLRFMLPALPPLVVLLAPAVERLLAGGRARIGILWSVLGVGFVVSLAGAWTGWWSAYSQWIRAGLNPGQPGFAWDLRFLVVPYAVRDLADPAALLPAWIRTIRFGHPEPWVVPVIAALLGSAVPMLHAVKWAPAGVRMRRLGLGAGLLALAASPFVLPQALARDPVHGAYRIDFQDAVTRLEQDIQPGDVVVVDSYATPLWSFMMNSWHSANVWYSLPFEISAVSDPVGTAPSPATTAAIDLFQELSMKTPRVWYLGSSDAPDFALGRKVEWLDDNFVLAIAESYAGSGRTVLRLYLTPRPTEP
ncbi:MAG: phospholipid carrier-dependent glycosyltransferase [Anaerolineales bacterium]